MSWVNREISTSKHLYISNDILGTGASCDVYTGIQKVTGEQHALKIFKDNLWSRSEERQREVFALRRLQHPNIIQFFGEEEEAGTGRVVLVLELCKEGSLYTFLHEPCNSRGLDDKEFLLLIGHLSAALLYMHSKKIVHRDIKPGNILRYIDYDGSCIYKLSDFGASRYIEDTDQFLSLAGTEEYLHPLVYEKAFVDRGAVICFDSSVDLWSVGCTLYQAATCQIPFRPYGGVRNNRTVMFQMIAQKPSGVISGHQTTENGPLTWERHIPSSARLSPILKADIQRLISRLLEKDQALLLSHDQFYQEVQTITRRIPIVIFNTEDSVFIDTYINPNCSMAELQDHIAGLTDVMAGDQLLFHRSFKLADLIPDGKNVDSLSCDMDEPIILICKTETEYGSKIPKPLENPPSFEADSNMKKDCEVSHKMAAYLHDVCERISNCFHIIRNSEKAISYERSQLEKWQSHLERSFSNIYSKLDETGRRLDLLYDLESKRVKITEEPNTLISLRCRQARSTLQKLYDPVQNVKKSMQEIAISIQSVIARPVLDRCTETCLAKAKTLYSKGRDIWRDNYTRKKQQHLSDRQQLSHKRDRSSIEEILISAMSLYDGHCLPNWKKSLAAHNACQETFRLVLRRQSDLNTHLLKIQHQIEKVEGTLVEINAFSGRAWNEVTEQMTSPKNGLLLVDEEECETRISHQNRKRHDGVIKEQPFKTQLQFRHESFENG